MKIHKGDLTITTANAKACEDITEVTGSLDISAGKFDAPQLETLHANKGRLLAISQYGLWVSHDGYYFAGCRGPLSREAALKYWDRTDERAKVFTAAIKAVSVEPVAA
jgi:hypothetical protein